MGTVYEYISWVRDFATDPHHKPHLHSNEFAWNQVCAAMDIIEDTESALSAYLTGEFAGDTGEKYLRVYGVLQALFVQQDALNNLIGAIHPDTPISVRKQLKEVREARNASVGHPTDHRGVSTHSMVRATMDKERFQLYSYSKKGGGVFTDVPLREFIETQRAEAVRVLSEVVRDLRQRDEKHRAEFRNVKFKGAFDQVGYAFEKIFEAARENSTLALGQWAVDHLQKSLEKFEGLLKNRGLTVGSYDSIEYLYHEIEYPLSQLKKFSNNESSEIESHRSAIVFATALEALLNRLVNIAQEIDKEYATGSETSLATG